MVSGQDLSTAKMARKTEYFPAVEMQHRGLATATARQLTLAAIYDGTGLVFNTLPA